MRIASETSIDVALAVDTSGFVRRACPSCGRHFKVKAQGESSLLLSAFTDTLEHANGIEIRAPGQRRCAYCGHRAPAQAFLTEAQRGWLDHWAKRLDAEVQVVRLRALDPFSAAWMQPSPKEPDQARPSEPDDMLPVALWCCGEQLKLKAGWREAYFCPRCGARQGEPA